MDATKSTVSTSVPQSTLSSTVHPAYSWQYQLAYEMEKLSELQRQVAAQEERFSAMQQQFEKLGNDSDTAGRNYDPIIPSLHSRLRGINISVTQRPSVC